MGKVTIKEYTTKNPITMIGEMAAVCVGVCSDNEIKNYKRGLDCLSSEHGRTYEFPDVYMEIEGYSARVIREWYTHILGSPTRLQESTRYVWDKEGFDYVIPDSIAQNAYTYSIYTDAMTAIQRAAGKLAEQGVPKEDAALLFPLGMTTKIVDKRNLRNLIEMSHQRMCNRAYHEYRDMFADIYKALRDYSDEWKYIVDTYFMPKCEYYGVCKEKKSCGAFHGNRW